MQIFFPASSLTEECNAEISHILMVQKATAKKLNILFRLQFCERFLPDEMHSGEH